MKVIAIAAMDQARVIGIDNGLPWRIPEDMKRFSALTSGHTVVMGRKTYESLPPKFRPLPNRHNVVLSRTPEALKSEQGIAAYSGFKEFLATVQTSEGTPQSEKIWIIGGEQIYRATLPFWDEVELTLVEGSHKGDAFFPEFEREFELESEAPGPGCKFQHFVRRR